MQLRFSCTAALLIINAKGSHLFCRMHRTSESLCDEKKKMKEIAYYLAAFSPSGKMILFTKKKMTMEMPPLSTVVPML